MAIAKNHRTLAVVLIVISSLLQASILLDAFTVSSTHNSQSSENNSNNNNNNNKMSSSSFRLQGQVIGLVGASSGIGAAIAHALYGEGASVAIGARRTSKLEEVATSCQQTHPTSPGSIVAFQCDVTDRKSVESFYEQTKKHFGGRKVNSLVCCAGVMYFTKMKNAMVDQWDQTIDVNCRGATNCMGVAIPEMLGGKKKDDDHASSDSNDKDNNSDDDENVGGKLVFITSDAGVRDFQQLAVYCASKRFVETLVEITRRELVGTGVTLHTIQPGDVKGTELILQNTDQEAATTMGVEIGKPVGEGFNRNQLLNPSDVADAVVTVLTAPKHVAINSILVEPRDQE